MSAVIGVIGGSGGIGASRFASVLAATAAEREGRSLLVDLDPAGGGIDIALGIEGRAGPRWSGLRLAGGVLDARLLLSGLPAWGATAVLACDGPALPPREQVTQVVSAARVAAPVVVDLARCATAAREAALELCALVVVICGCDLAATAAARAVVSMLEPVPIALVGRGARSVAARAGEFIGAPVIGRLRAVRTRDAAPLAADSLPRALSRVARGVLAGLPAPSTATGQP